MCGGEGEEECSIMGEATNPAIYWWLSGDSVKLQTHVLELINAIYGVGKEDKTN